MSRYFEKLNFSIVLTMLTWLVGGFDIAIKVLCLLMIIDYITGLCKAFINKNLSSRIGYLGILRKSGIFFMIFLAAGIDRVVSGDVFIFRTMIVYFYIANEGLSILENIEAMGIPVPDFISEALNQIKDKK